MKVLNNTATILTITFNSFIGYFWNLKNLRGGKVKIHYIFLVWRESRKIRGVIAFEGKRITKIGFHFPCKKNVWETKNPSEFAHVLDFDFSKNTKDSVLFPITFC